MSSSGFTGLPLEGEEHLGGPQFREKMARFAALPADAGAVDLARMPRASVEQRAALPATQSPEVYAGIVTCVDGTRVTRREMLQFVKEHELTHRSQIFLYPRLKGVVPSTTRRRLAKQTARQYRHGCEMAVKYSCNLRGLSLNVGIREDFRLW